MTLLETQRILSVGGADRLVSDRSKSPQTQLPLIYFGFKIDPLWKASSSDRAAGTFGDRKSLKLLVAKLEDYAPMFSEAFSCSHVKGQILYQTDNQQKVPYFHGVRKKIIWEVA